MGIAVLNHLLHVHQVRGVGREVVLNALLVADIYHDVAEDAAGGTVAHGYTQSALKHIFSIRTADD